MKNVGLTLLKIELFDHKGIDFIYRDEISQCLLLL